MSNRKAQSYRDLEIWQMAHGLAVIVHKSLFDDLCKRYDVLGRKINSFLQSVIIGHLSPKEPGVEETSEDE